MPETADIDLTTYNPLDPAYQQDPFPAYAALRRHAPVFKHPTTGLYFVSCHATVRQVLSDTDTFSSRMSNAATAPPPSMASELREQLDAVRRQIAPPSDTMLTADPPRQTRYRKAMGRDFNQRVPRLEKSIREISAKLLDAWPADRVDFMNGFAVPFPVRSIACVLTMDPSLEADIKRWSDDSVAGLGQQIDDARRLEAARGVLELQRYWTERVDTSRDQPRDDFVSDLAKAQIEDDELGSRRPLDTPEAISILQQLMVAGNETTTKLLNETMKLFAENPDQWRRLREDPSRIESCVEEALRLSSPNQGLFRQVRADAELEGVKIPKGSTVWVMFGSANRDEDVFPDPDRFDPDRPNLREHLAFGHGAHFCIGAPLARLEAKVALEEISNRVEAIRIPDDAQLRYEPSFILRGLAELTLEIDRA